MTRPGSGSPTVSSRSSRPLAQTAPACLAGRRCPGRWPAARPGRCRRTAAVPPEMPPTTPVKVAYMPAGPGSGPRTSAGQARAGSLQCWGRCQRMWATSAGETSSQVWPKARPAACPVAHTSAPAPAAAPRPTARSWSPGLVNGGESGGRCPPGGSGGQPSCHIRATPRGIPGPNCTRDCFLDQALKDDLGHQDPVADANCRELPFGDLPVQRHWANAETLGGLSHAVGQAVIGFVAIIGLRYRPVRRRARISMHPRSPISMHRPRGRGHVP